MGKKYTKSQIIFFALVLILVIGIAGFFYYRNTVFSRQILKLEILGPDMAKMGDEVQYTVVYQNNGNFALENPKVTFDLPDNTLTEDGKTRFTQDLQDIEPGQEGSLQFSGRLLGKEGDLKTAHVMMTYTPHNLSVRYESDTSFITKIDSVPITLTLDLPSQAERGKEINYAVNYFSNVDYPLENLSVKIDPVDGISIENANPTSLDNVEWKLPTLQKSDGGRITIKSAVASDAPDTLSFVAHLGMWQDGVFVVIKDVNYDVATIQNARLELLQKAYFSTTNGIENSGPTPPKVGQSTTYTIVWQVNNYVNDVGNVKVKAVLPENVSVSDAIVPEDQASHFSFDNSSREVVWLVDKIPASSQAQISFQVSLTPTADQQGLMANLIGQATVQGQDQTTNNVTQSTAAGINTSLPDDAATSGGGAVQ